MRVVLVFRVLLFGRGRVVIWIKVVSLYWKNNYMKRTYYLFNPGRLIRKDNTLKFTPVDEEGREGQPRYIPVETVDNLFVFGSFRCE